MRIFLLMKRLVLLSGYIFEMKYLIAILVCNDFKVVILEYS